MPAPEMGGRHDALCLLGALGLLAHTLGCAPVVCLGLRLMCACVCRSAVGLGARLPPAPLFFSAPNNRASKNLICGDLDNV